MVARSKVPTPVAVTVTTSWSGASVGVGAGVGEWVGVAGDRVLPEDEAQPETMSAIPAVIAERRQEALRILPKS